MKLREEGSAPAQGASTNHGLGDGGNRHDTCAGIEAGAIPLKELVGSGGKLRDAWLDTVTSVDGAPREARRIAYALVYHANNKTFQLWPSVPLLARRLAMGENTIRRAIKWLISSGWLILLRKGGGRSRPTRYVLSVPRWIIEEGA